MLREVVVRPRGDREGGVLFVRVYERAEGPAAGYELRGEDREGNAWFAFSDPHRFLVMEEFERLVGELAEEPDRFEVLDPGHA
ncbi:MAG: hypothetical protein Kow0092_02470 [Deferrisomatales bacterium]